MEELPKTVSGKHGGKKLVFMTTQRYKTSSGKFGKVFVVILYVELYRVCARKWNVERVIVFQYVILQRAQVVNNSAKI